MPLEIFGLVFAAAIAWLWLDSIRVRESAVAAAREACIAEGLLLLDDTVAFTSLRPARDDNGRVKLQRSYDFEYSDTGDNRRKGSVVMLGSRLVLFNIGLRAVMPRRLS